MEKKRCNRCEKYLSTEEFCKSNGSKDGLANYCKLCKREYQKLNNSRKFKRNPAMYLLKKSCSAAFTRGKPTYQKDGYDHVTTSYGSAKEFFQDLWIDKDFMVEWERQTNIYLKTDRIEDRPTLDRIDASKGYEKSNIRMLPRSENAIGGGAKETYVFIIKNLKLHSKETYRSIAEAKSSTSKKYGFPINVLRHVDEGRIIEIGNGLSFLIQTKGGKIKPNQTNKYLMVLRKTAINYELNTLKEAARQNMEFRIELSGISYLSSFF